MGHRHHRGSRSGQRRRLQHRGRGEQGRTHITVALAGNANVGKSVIFNELTGLHQHVGNWPGKTVERAEGTLTFLDYVVDIIDLPGIYSLSTYSIEELVSREYIAVKQPDVLVNVVDASVLERNLFFTLQLLELEPRMVVALNQVDIAESKGIRVDPEKLSKLLGVPIVPMVAVKGVGIGSLMREVIEAAEEEREAPPPILYGSEVEKRLEALTEAVRGIDTPYPGRWVAIKLLEGDDKIRQIIYGADPSIEEQVRRLNGEIEEIHGHDTPSVIASERYHVANRIAAEASTHLSPRTTYSDR
ncbi:MAG: 50S ribosome-binding GTPase, partial [Candidatus Bathyarchaeota archaeon]|nr:50S ribosome-binding GTPase [Candidatus Bathyarchaeota archaeon]